MGVYFADTGISQFKFRIVVERRRNRPRIVVCRVVGTVPGILGLVWPSFRPKSGSKSKISGRILKSFRGPFISAVLGHGGLLEEAPGRPTDGVWETSQGGGFGRSPRAPGPKP